MNRVKADNLCPVHTPGRSWADAFVFLFAHRIRSSLSIIQWDPLKDIVVVTIITTSCV